MSELGAFAVGMRVQAHPGTAAWMSGDRFGVVACVGRTWVHVEMDRSGRIRRFHPDRLVDLDGGEL